jgi:SAM-dependent methyltransferase
MTTAVAIADSPRWRIRNFPVCVGRTVGADVKRGRDSRAFQDLIDAAVDTASHATMRATSSSSPLLTQKCLPRYGYPKHYRAVVPGRWDESLYAGSAEYYRVGRMPYPERLLTTMQRRLALDGHGSLLDLGCGPGGLTLLLAPLFAAVVAVDSDADMIRVGQGEAARNSAGNVSWLCAYAEDLDDGLGPFTVVTLAQSFHWMNRPVVAHKIRQLLTPDGYCVHVGATTHQGVRDATGLPHPQPPWDGIHDLVRAHLGPDRRAGKSIVVDGSMSGDEESVFRAAQFTGPEVIDVPGGDVLLRSEDQVVASVLSLSSSAPHLFGDDLAMFVAELRALLAQVSSDGQFSEQLQGIRLSLWRTR